MGFQTGLSGLNAASRNLDVIGNNIANAGTAGAKRSRAEFSEVIASTLSSGGGGSGNLSGIGVEISAVSQEFSQGNISVTGNDLDIAINGSGFFPLIAAADKSTSAEPSLYTRAGMFKLDKDGYIITNNGNKLWGINYNYAGQTANGAPAQENGPLQLPTTKPLSPKQTTSLSVEANLNARDQVYRDAAGNPVVAESSWPNTTITTYDEQGTPIYTKIAFEKTGTNTWNVIQVTKDPTTKAEVYTNIIGNLAFGNDGTLTKDAAGNITGITGGTGPNGELIANVQADTGNTAAFDIVVNLNPTQLAAVSGVTDQKQDGYPVGFFTGLKISEQGEITARYSNGQNRKECQVMLRDFRNQQGLKPVGGGNWVETAASGNPITGKPGDDNFGLTRSGALEDSNVDLTAELVNMMTAQRAYQANVQTIKTQDQALSALTQLR